MGDLYIMCGVPGAGKSTFLKNKIKSNKGVIISRDEIRFSLVKPNESYFSKEKEVIKIFWNEINKELASGNTVFVDQTSLTRKSRKWLLEHIIIDSCNHINLIWVDESLETCLKRNEQRKGTRSYVPRESIVNMHNSFEEPSLDEGFYRIFKYNSTNDKITYKGVIL